MSHWHFTQKKFLSLELAHQHKKASQLLKTLFTTYTSQLETVYRNLEDWLKLPSLDLSSHEAVSHRFHWHLQQANISWKEHSYLHVRHLDTCSEVPFLPIHIYLDSLRSAFNVGSILRTVEAFRLGTVHFSKTTPTPSNPKVQKASMNTYQTVPCQLNSLLETLPRPWIALETATPSTSLYEYCFPTNFTLILGNEEFGVSKEILKQCDTILEIPLVGGKNSLNVASALAIAASFIRIPSKGSQ